MDKRLVMILVRILAVLGGITLTALFLYLLVVTVILSAMSEGLSDRDQVMIALLCGGLIVGWGVGMAAMFWLWDAVD